MSSALSWDIRQRRVTIPYRLFGPAYRFHLKGSRNSRNLDLLTLENWTDRLSRNVGNHTPTKAGLNPRKLLFTFYFLLSLIQFGLRFVYLAEGCIMCTKMKDSPKNCRWQKSDMKFHSEALQLLDATVQNLVARASWPAEFVYRYHSFSLLM